MIYKNDKFILDDGHIVKGYEAIQIYNQVEYNSRSAEMCDEYMEKYGKEPDENLLDKLTEEFIKELQNDNDTTSDIRYNVMSRVMEEYEKSRETDREM